jgi:Zn ribbon nucleic-acid-binding protein
MKMQVLITAGLRCPACKSDNLRSGYHEWHHYDAYICDACGFRWEEDLYRDPEKLFDALQNHPEDLKDRLIWVLHVVTEPYNPLTSTLTGDEGSYKKFIKAK